MRAGSWTIVVLGLLLSGACAWPPEVGWTPMPYQTADQRRRADDARPHPRLARPGKVNVTTRARAHEAWSDRAVLAQLTLDGLLYRSLGAPSMGPDTGPVDLLELGETEDVTSAPWWRPTLSPLNLVAARPTWGVELRSPTLGRGIDNTPSRFAGDLRLRGESVP